MLTGQKFNHTDIDVITMNNTYLDDATTFEEKCFGLIPFSENYIDKHKLSIHFEGKNALISDPITQIWSKLVGELTVPFTQDARKQLKALREVVHTLAPSENQLYEQTEDIYYNIVPANKFAQKNIIYFFEAMHKNTFSGMMNVLNHIHKSVIKAYEDPSLKIYGKPEHKPEAAMDTAGPYCDPKYGILRV